MAKLLENIFRSVNIALVNELAELADRMGIDIWEVVDAAATKPYGFMRFDPGPGMGGHCLPVDPFYLTWKARELDFSHRVHRAGRQGQPAGALHCVDKVERKLNELGMPVKRRADRDPRRLLQARRRRRPRAPGAEDHRAPAASWGPRWPTTTRRAGAAAVSACESGSLDDVPTAATWR